MPVAHLAARTAIEVAGVDRVAFLQGLVSNDMALAAPGRCVWAALLTPQGKWLADFFVFADDARLLLDAQGDQAAMVMEKLSRFRLRSQVALRELPGLHVAAGWGDAPMPDGVAAHDPRLPEAGWRALLPVPPPSTGDYDAHRLALGLPDGSRDLDAEQSVLLEAGFDELHGVSWTKGCYMGQELTARTKYRGLVKRRLVPVRIEGEAPESGTPIMLGGAEVGEMRSSRGPRGLARLRVAAARAPALACGAAMLVPEVPAWMRLPEPADA